MDQTRIFVRGHTFSPGDLALQDALARIYDSPERPRCMCVQGGVEMYIAKHRDFVVKRMPGTGQRHHATCPSFEPEPGSSGLGELVGEAIVEHAPGQVEIRTDFPLARVTGRPMPRGDGTAEPSSVKAPRKRMSLRALLHYLYDKAGFNRWYPGMAGKRTQNVIQHFIMEAAGGIALKGVMLNQRLYVPETFRVTDKDEIGRRRREKLAMLMSPEADVQFKMAILIGEFLGVEQTPGGGRYITVKHMPDVPLGIDTKAWEKAERGYSGALQALQADVERKPKVLMAALIYAKREHLYQVDSLTLMLVTEQWLPLDGLHELQLVEALQREGRAFLKPLRYDAKSAAAYPNVLLLDAGAAPVPLHLVSPFVDPKEQAAKRKTVEAAGGGTWLWETDKPIPALPPVVRPAGARQRGEVTAAAAPSSAS